MIRLEHIIIGLALALAMGRARLPVQAWSPQASKLSPSLQRLMGQLPGGGRLAVIVHLRDSTGPSPRADLPAQANRPQTVIETLQARAARAQKPLLEDLRAAQAQGEAGQVTPLWITNAVLVEASPALLNALALRADVSRIVPDYDPQDPLVPVGGPALGALVGLSDPALSGLLSPLQAGPPEPNLGVIGATDLWAMGYTGQGVTVAVLDSGVDSSHPDLAGRYRGGNDSWYDPYGQYAAPADTLGHGTWVTGVVVGDGTDGHSTGVAPGAQWIAAKIFPTPPKVQSLAAVHQAFQWVLDPDGDPATPDAPQIVNNSWDFANPGCNLEFQPDLLALRAAGILPVFAAGNYGPGAGSDASPANNQGALAVGAVDNSGLILASSSRGPNSCDPGQLFPGLVAPGQSILTTDLSGSYIAETGTSLAAPHVSGGLALLLSIYPHLSPALQEQYLITGAVDLGPAGPDSDYGHGLIYLPAALGRLNFTYLPLIGH